MALFAGITMLTTVQFYGQVGFFTEKIEVVFADWMLASEFITAKTTVA